MAAKPMIVAGDIGGTNSRLEIYAVERTMLQKNRRAPGDIIFAKTYANENYPSFLEILKTFLREAGLSENESPEAACIAVAGPVAKNRVTFTNRGGWEICGKRLERQLGISRVELVNDFVAAGYGLLTLDLDREVEVLTKCCGEAGGPIACIGAGTGLGEVYLTCPPGGHYTAYASEGGHAEWCPKDALQVEMNEYLKAKFGEPNRISVERIVSGPGLASMYEFLAQKYPDRVDPEVQKEYECAGDLKGKVIATNSKVQGSICEQVMQMFAKEYGYEAAVAALKWLPTGGLFIAGGLTPKNIDLIAGENSPFITAYHDKGRVKGCLKSIPMYAVMEEDIGLRGAHYFAFQIWFNMDKPQQTETEKKLARAVEQSQKIPSHIRLIGATIGVAGIAFIAGFLGHKLYRSNK